jgi:hypothetical protein
MARTNGHRVRKCFGVGAIFALKNAREECQTEKRRRSRAGQLRLPRRCLVSLSPQRSNYVTATVELRYCNDGLEDVGAAPEEE